MGEVVRKRENALRLYDYWIADLVFSAIFDRDIDAIEKIITRVDGISPDTDTKHIYANYFSDALSDVFDMPHYNELHLFPDDPVIIALAKCTIAISLQVPGTDIQIRKAKHKAQDLILERMGGRRTAPVSRMEAIEFDDPDWMKQLPEPEATSDSSENTTKGVGENGKEKGNNRMEEQGVRPDSEAGGIGHGSMVAGVQAERDSTEDVLV